MKISDIKDFLFVGHIPSFIQARNLQQFKYLSCVPIGTPKDIIESYPVFSPLFLYYLIVKVLFWILQIKFVATAALQITPSKAQCKMF